MIKRKRKKPVVLNFTLLLLCTLSFTVQAQSPYPVYWSRLNSLSYANDELTKLNFSSWNNSAVSINTLADDANGFIEYTVDNTGSYHEKVIGFVEEDSLQFGPDEYKDIYYAMQISDSRLYRWSPTTSNIQIASLAVNDVIRVERTGTTFRIKLNGTVVDSLLNADTKEMHIKVCLYAYDAKIKNLRCSFAAQYQSLPVFNTSVNSLVGTSSGNSGSIDLSVSGGTGTYSYHWLPDNETTQDIANKTTGTYTVNVTDANTNQNLVVGLGYRVYWDSLQDISFAGDSLHAIDFSSWNASANSINQLPANTNGWIEWAVDGRFAYNYRMFGFIDSDHSPLGTDQSLDIDYGFYVPDSRLYKWGNGGSICQEVTTLNTGDLLRIERSGSIIYYKINGRTMYTQSASSAALYIKAVLGSSQACLSGLRCSFAAPYQSVMSFNSSVTNLNQSSDENTGNISLSINGGTSPYTYSWLPGNETTSTIANKAVGTYTATISDANTSKTISIGVGYRIYWDSLIDMSNHGDTIVKQSFNDWKGSATSINKLAANTNGWIEWTVDRTDGGNRMFGLLADNNTPIGSDQYDDLDYGFYIPDERLYKWDNGQDYEGIAILKAGDILRIERIGSTMYYKLNGQTMYTKTNVNTGVLYVKAILYSAYSYFGGIRCSFAAPYQSTPNLSCKATGIDPATDNNTGNIDLSVNGGTSPYSYHWLPGGETTQDIRNKTIGTYTVNVTDANTSRRLSIGIGYRAYWDSIQGLTSSGDTLYRTTNNGTWNCSANSLNKLPANTDGWIEWTLDQFNNKVFGFLDTDHTAPGTDQSGDIDYGVYLPDQRWYKWDNGGADYEGITTLKIGDVIRIERLGSTMYYKLNGHTLYTKTNVNTGALYVKMLLVNYSTFSDLRCSFDLNKPRISLETSPLNDIDGNTGSITAYASAGTPPYTYLWSNGSTASTIAELGPGDYKLTLTDAAGQSVQKTASIAYRTQFEETANISFTDNGLSLIDASATGTVVLKNQLPPATSGYTQFSLSNTTADFNLAMHPADLTVLPNEIIRTYTTTVSTEAYPVGSTAYNRLNIADDQSGVAEGYIRVNGLEFVDGNLASGDRLRISTAYGIAVKGNAVYVLSNGYTIEKPVTIAANDIVRTGVANGSFYVMVNGSTKTKSNFNANTTSHYAIGLILNSGQIVFNGTGLSNTIPVTVPINHPNYGCAADYDHNWVYNKSFDKNGNIISESKSYIDYLGRSAQNQSKDLSKNNVIATQSIYDVYGRGVVQTLPAPINQTNFCFKADFVTNAQNQAYSYADFDLPDYSTSATAITAGEVSNPKAVNNSNAGSLGWYYSNNNTLEPLVDASGFPYARVEFNEYNGGGTKKSSGAGDVLRMGNGHETQAYTLPVTGELTPIYGCMKKWMIDNFDPSTGNITNTFGTNLQALKNISYDANGKESVSFTDLSGNLLAKGLSGQESGESISPYSLTSIVTVKGKKTIYKDIHIPKGCENSFNVNIYGAAGTAANIDPYSYKILDIRAGKFLSNGTSTNFNLRTLTLQPGIYRIIFNGLSADTDFANFTVTHAVNYHKLSVYYYDKAGRVKVIVPPTGFNANLGSFANEVHEQARAYPFSLFVNGFGHSTPSAATVVPQTLTWTPIIAAGNTGSNPSKPFDDLVNYVTPPASGQDQLTAITVSLKNIVPPTPGGGCSTCNTSRIISPDSMSYSFVDSVITANDPNAFKGINPILPSGNPGSIGYVNDVIGGEGEPPVLDPCPHCGTVPGGGTGTGNATNNNPVYETSTWQITFNYDVLKTAAGTTTTIYPDRQIKIYRSIERVLTVNGYVVVKSSLQFDQPQQYYLAGADNSNLSQLKLKLKTIDIVRTGDPHLGYNSPTAYYAAEVSDHWGLSLATAITRYSGTIQNTRIESNDYNSLSQVIRRRKVEEGTTEYVYRKDGGIKFTQNLLQKNHGSTFNYSNYDKYGRVTEVGEYQTASSGNNTTFQNYENRAQQLAAGTNDANSVHNFTESSVVNNNAPDNVSFSTYDIADPNFNSLTGLSTYTQQFLAGRVSKTKNGNKTSWYSYDDFGRLSWMVQRIENMPTGGQYKIKTIEYSYNFNGAVTQVDYQKGQADQFSHFYEYDRNMRILRVSAGRTAATRKEQAEYKYYAHGALKRAELADNLQGLDYVYNINGWLKAVNSPELNGIFDPAKDGTINSTTHTPKDLFGFELDYFSGDYSRSGTTIENYSNSSNTFYNGLINTFRWQTTAPSAGNTTLNANYNNKQLAYQYSYDNQYQLTSATFGTIDAPGGNQSTARTGYQFLSTDDYKVWNLTYDNNGNIQTLNRNGYLSSGSQRGMDQLTYSYTALSNKLHKVSDALSSTAYPGEIKNGQSDNNYLYDEIGQMTADGQKGLYLNYDAYGNVETVWLDANRTLLKAQFKYDEGGQRLYKRMLYRDAQLNISNTKETWYVRDGGGTVVSTYEQQSNVALAQTEINLVGAGRIGMVQVNGTQDKYVYELNDHLGNVRATFGKTTISTVQTGFEGTGTYDYLFNFNAQIDNTKDISGGAGSSVLTDPGVAGGKGTALTFNVTGGQSISAVFNSWYSQTNFVPDAWLKADLKDVNGNVLDTKLQHIRSGSAQWLEATLTYTVSNTYSTAATLTIYPYNADASGAPVWFDNLSITNSSGFAVPEQLSLSDYYPGGSVLPGRTYNAASGAYRYAYQGQFAENEEELGYSSFDLRMYDVQLMRFFSPDPYEQYFSPYMAMNNNPVSSVDPTGGMSNAGGNNESPSQGLYDPEAIYHNAFQQYISGTPHNRALLQAECGTTNDFTRYYITDANGLHTGEWHSDPQAALMAAGKNTEQPALLKATDLVGQSPQYIAATLAVQFIQAVIYNVSQGNGSFRWGDYFEGFSGSNKVDYSGEIEIDMGGFKVTMNGISIDVASDEEMISTQFYCGTSLMRSGGTGALLGSASGRAMDTYSFREYCLLFAGASSTTSSKISFFLRDNSIAGMPTFRNIRSLTGTSFYSSSWERNFPPNGVPLGFNIITGLINETFYNYQSNPVNGTFNYNTTTSWR